MGVMAGGVAACGVLVGFIWLAASGYIGEKYPLSKSLKIRRQTWQVK